MGHVASMKLIKKAKDDPEVEDLSHEIFLKIMELKEKGKLKENHPKPFFYRVGRQLRI